jgi:catalase
MEEVKKVIHTTKEKIAEVISPGTAPHVMTLGNGCPIAHLKDSLTVGPHGPVLLQDYTLLEKASQFVREKIPARNVHALGAGCYGTFTCTNDITQYCGAKLFSNVGKKTEIFARLSGTFTEQGDPDTTRDIRGFAIKFYTEEGNWDLLTINLPVFIGRDGKTGPDGVHSFKRDPRTGMWNPSQTWDYVATHPDALHAMLMMYTDRVGTPLTFRHQHYFGGNTFSFLNAEKKRVWVKFHLVSELGAKGMDQRQAKILMGEDPNWLCRDLHQAVELGNYPRWKLCCQIMPEDEGYRNPLAFDVSKVWSHKEYPLIDIGIVELNRNPVDYFSEVEQVAFSPARIVPGISYSPDRLLQGRLLYYDEAQYHRIGPNFRQLPINTPRGTFVNTMYVGGNMHIEIRDKFPHYYPNSYGNVAPDPKYMEPPMRCDGPAAYYDLPGEGTYEDYYAQPAVFLTVLSELERQHLYENLAASLYKVDEHVYLKLIQRFSQINAKFAQTVSDLVTERKAGKVSDGEKLAQGMAQMVLKTTVSSH